jgi:aspartate/methionine/tyrosine aminotransferase
LNALVVPVADRVRALASLSAEARDPVSRGAAVAVPEAVRTAAQEALARGETHYTDRPGILPLRQNVAAALAQAFGIDVDAKNGVVVTCGGTEARFVAVQQLLPPGGTLVALSHPERVAAACLIRGVTLAGPDDAPSGAAVVVVLAGDTPHDVADAWLARARANGWAIVFEGDAGGRHPAALGYGDLTITIGSIGLAQGMASWRLGYLAAPAAKAGPLRDFKQALTICSTNVSQWGALALESDLA